MKQEVPPGLARGKVTQSLKLGGVACFKEGDSSHHQRRPESLEPQGSPGCPCPGSLHPSLCPCDGRPPGELG